MSIALQGPPKFGTNQIGPSTPQEWAVFYRWCTSVFQSAGVSSLNALFGALTLLAGSGISIVTAGANITLANTGVLSLNALTGALQLLAGAGLALTTAGSALTLANTGVLSLNGLAGNPSITAGSNVTVTVAGTNIQIAASGGVLSLNALTGALSITAGTGISVTPGAPNIAIANTGVTSAVAGNNISVSGATGAVTIATNVGAARSLAHNSANQSILNTTNTALTFDTNDYDLGSVHSTSVNTSRFTMPTTGFYLISGQALWNNSAAGNFRVLQIKKNGTTLITQSYACAPTAGNNPTCFVSVPLSLAASDYVEFVVQQDSGGALSVLGGSPTELTWGSVFQLA